VRPLDFENLAAAMPTIHFTEGEYLFRVDRYWEKKEQFRNGSCFQSRSFRRDDYFWRISYYPNGAWPSSTDHVSIFVALRSRVGKPVRARVRFSLLDRNGEPGQSAYTDVYEYSVPGEEYGFHEFIRKDYLEASKLLVNGGITIRCDIFFVDREGPRLRDCDFLAATDVIIRVHGFPFRAHRCVFTARSPALAAELAKWDNTTRKCIPIDGISVQAFQALLHFVYTDTLTEMNEQQESLIAEDLLAAADRFELPDLKEICVDILSSLINENTVAKMLNLAVQHHCQTLHEYCIEFLRDHPALDAIMASDDGSLLDHVAKSCPEFFKDLCTDWCADDPIQNDCL
jgi:speckle-type POZ protein